ncbi:hypothetical protein CWI36_0327p0010 [Hamiltosporidium magnivora]|uniref:Uncharacterized protein n=1 Tax=Hamiltosporidium magnivora TaxID=148818 RepID=A0A4V2JW91_9MICR|nr:hypothetical protein CWI36_0327p0010 [Hamiltosporidium magnivora]
MRAAFFLITIFPMIATMKCISNMKINCGKMHIIGRMVYGAMNKEKEQKKQWEDDFTHSMIKHRMRIILQYNLNPHYAKQIEQNCFVTTNTFEDFFDFHYIIEPGFRCIKESIFDTIDFLTTDEFTEDIYKRTKEYFKKENNENENLIDEVISEFNSLLIEKFKFYLDKNNADLFEDVFLALQERINTFIVQFKSKNNLKLIEAVQDNKKMAIRSNILEVLKSKFYLFDCVENLISQFYQILYVKLQKDIYFNFFYKTNQDCIKLEKETNDIYKRLQNMKKNIKYDDDLDNIFVSFSEEEESSSFMNIFSVFCTRTAEIQMNLKKAKTNLKFLAFMFFTDKFKIFQFEFFFSKDILYFQEGFSNKIASEFLDICAPIFVMRITHISFIDLQNFFPEFLSNVSKQFINSANKFCLGKIIQEESESISDHTKYLIGNIPQNSFEISLDSFREIYNAFLNEKNENNEMFLIHPEEMKACRDFFFKCILFRIKCLTEKFNVENISSIELEIIKEKKNINSVLHDLNYNIAENNVKKALLKTIALSSKFIMAAFLKPGINRNTKNVIFYSLYKTDNMNSDKIVDSIKISNCSDFK